MSSDSSASSPVENQIPAGASSVPTPDAAPAAESAEPRVQIGSQRAGNAKVKAKPQFAPRNVVEKQGPKVEVPNIRHRFTPEMDVELAMAMGGLSVDEALTGANMVPTLAPDTRVKGRVVQVHNDDVFIDLGGKTQGVLSLRQLPDFPEVGTVVDVIIDRMSNDDGLYLVRLPTGAVEVADWNEVAEGMIVEARVTVANKGGLECMVNNLRAFLPAGQVSPYRVEDLTQFVGEKFACLVTECNPARRNLVLSRRAVMEYEKEQAREKLWTELEEGQVREGTVRSLQDFGAFVDLGGADGLIHISQMSWKKIRHPSDLLKIGDTVKVLIRKLDRETRKIALTLRDLTDNPWTNVTAKYPVTSEVRGTVSRVADFGAFVELEPGIEGLVHISELSHTRVFRVADFIKVGDTVNARVVSLDLDAQRIGLSMKALQARPESKSGKSEPAEDETPLEPFVAKHKGPLKGGVQRPSSGDAFGLKW
jgi:small subunit ribosomal protein S1